MKSQFLEVQARHRGRAIVHLGFLLLAAGCADEDVTELETNSSTLDTRMVDGHREINRARSGVASSSGAFPGQPASYINDGRRGAPAEAYWASSNSATVYNCNYDNWWVSVQFRGPSGTSCPFGGCAYW